MEMIDCVDYVNKQVKIELKNGRYYRGLCLSCGKDFIRIRDINDKEVMIVIQMIALIEVGL